MSCDVAGQPYIKRPFEDTMVLESSEHPYAYARMEEKYCPPSPGSESEAGALYDELMTSLLPGPVSFEQLSSEPVHVNYVQGVTEAHYEKYERDYSHVRAHDSYPEVRNPRPYYPSYHEVPPARRRSHHRHDEYPMFHHSYDSPSPSPRASSHPFGSSNMGPSPYRIMPAHYRERDPPHPQYIPRSHRDYPPPSHHYSSSLGRSHSLPGQAYRLPSYMEPPRAKMHYSTVRTGSMGSPSPPHYPSSPPQGFSLSALQSLMQQTSNIPAKKNTHYMCGNCFSVGHNRRTCPFAKTGKGEGGKVNTATPEKPAAAAGGQAGGTNTGTASLGGK